MKNYKSVIIIVLLIGIVSSQENIGGIPYSQNNKVNMLVDRIVMESFDVQSMINEDETRNSGKMRYGKIFDLNLFAENVGSWQILEDGSILWRLIISSENAPKPLFPSSQMEFLLPHHALHHVWCDFACGSKNSTNC